VGAVMGPKFTHEEYGEFIVSYYRGDFKDWAYNRLGQAFFWHFNDKGIGGVKDPELFYTRDDEVAIRLIYERYLVP
jgi:hypothetical protein